MELTPEQRARYEQLKQEYEEKAGSVLRADEAARRSHETVESEVRQKKEVMASHQQELESTRKVVQELRGQLARLSTSKSDCERVVRRLEEESAALQNEYAATSELLQQKRRRARRCGRDCRTRWTRRRARTRRRSARRWCGACRGCFPK